jgi:protein-L-isoaspartate(D-aspartate) O-methyltransferase
MNFEAARAQMLGQQLRAWEVLDDRVLRAVEQTPRERFVPEEYRELAFADTEIPIGHGQSMLAPKIEGRLLQALQVEPIDDVLEVGTGTGFLTACLSRLARSVASVDIFPDFVEAARAKLAEDNVLNTELATADALSLSLELSERFDAIAVTASMPVLDDHFVRMLRPQGRLFIVVGRPPVMEARLITRAANGDTLSQDLFETVLTPLINVERPEPFVL